MNRCFVVQFHFSAVVVRYLRVPSKWSNKKRCDNKARIETKIMSPKATNIYLCYNSNTYFRIFIWCFFNESRCKYVFIFLITQGKRKKDKENKLTNIYINFLHIHYYYSQLLTRSPFKLWTSKAVRLALLSDGREEN